VGVSVEITHVNSVDLPGRRFNGHDLQLSFNTLGHEAYQFFVQKLGDDPNTISMRHE